MENNTSIFKAVRDCVASRNWEAAIKLLGTESYFQDPDIQENTKLLEAKRLSILADCYNALSMEVAKKLGIPNARSLAESSALAAIRLLEGIADRANLRAQALNALGISKWYLNSPAEALRFFETACEILMTSGSTKAHILNTSLQNLALCHHANGNLREAIDCLQEAMPLLDKTGSQEQTFDLKIRLANLYADDGKHHAAKSLLDEIKPRESSDTDLLIRWYNASALLASSLGDVLYADTLFDRIHDLFCHEDTQAGNRLAALTNAASFKLDKGWTGQALAIVELIESQLHSSASFWFRVGYQKLKMRLAFRLEDQKGAKAAYDEACELVKRQAEGNTEQLLEIAIVALDGQSSEELKQTARQMIGDILGTDTFSGTVEFIHGERFDAFSCLIFEMNEVSEAEHLDRLLPMGIMANLFRSQSPLGWKLFHALARCKAVDKKYRAAILAAKIALYEIASSIDQQGYSGKDGKRSLAQCQIISCLLSELMIHQGLIEEWQHIEYLIRVICAGPTYPCSNAGPGNMAETLFSWDEYEIVCKWIETRTNFTQLYNQVSGTEDFERHMREFNVQAATATNSFLDAIASLDGLPLQEHHPMMAGAGTGLGVIQAKVHQVRLGLFAGSESCLIVFEADGRTNSRRLKTSPRIIRETITLAKKQIFSGLDDWRHTGRLLYEMIFAELVNEFSNHREIFISSSGFFSELPLEIINVDDKLLLERFAIVRSSPESELPSPILNKDNQIIIVGSSSRHGPDGELALVKSEAHQIRRMFPKTTVLMDAEFTKQALFKGLGTRPSILHLATHFTFLPGAPSSSFFHTGADERLSLNELLGENSLCGIDLVFNCACGSARSTQSINPDRHANSFVDALSVADMFIFRGRVQAYIGTAWDITDAAAVRCASEFYRHLRDGETYAKALQMTMVNMSLENEFANPKDWAAFRLFTSREQ